MSETSNNSTNSTNSTNINERLNRAEERARRAEEKAESAILASSKKFVTIEPFFDLIIKAFMSILTAILKGILSPVLAILKKLAKILVDFVADKVLMPIFRPIGEVLKIFVSPLRPLFAFIGKIIEFIVSIIRFVAKIVDMILSLPFLLLGTNGLGLIKFPDDGDQDFKDLKAVSKLGSTVRDVNLIFTDSASSVNKVVNKPNLIIFLTIIVLSVILITLYFFYDQFNSIVDEIVKFVRAALYKKPE
jgi:hypothetical protein